MFSLAILKSNNLQYNMLGRWVHGTNDSWTATKLKQILQTTLLEIMGKN